MSQFVSAGETAGRYVDWGVIHVSVTNLVLIGLMILVFVLALIVPFPSARRAKAGRGGSR